MARIAYILPALALGLQLFAQGTPAKEGAKPHAESVATPALSANQGINPDELIAVRATPYRPTLQRDPFSAPTDAEQTNKGDLVDDIGVKGMVVSNGKVLAVVTDARGNVRSLPIGYRFRDGELVAINDKSVTFHQWDASSTNTKIFRTVVKTFKREEGKR
ncbi:hypothetical protein [Mesoterricola silvestris]|uniref:Pilus assembly protein PilP n=1 Tax=Mesoterricola silvestris TaxID=2927979 RepID=A0AA48K811_9BACT|nr:hypothetical protein [Mesoterricola silvestris]BDU72469.1 hypothetical protein METEAL_16430 [Mesoterricola silvestris]